MSHVRIDPCPKEPERYVLVRARGLDDEPFKRFREVVAPFGNYEGGRTAVRRDVTGALTKKLRAAGIAVWLAPVLEAEVAREGVAP